MLRTHGHLLALATLAVQATAQGPGSLFTDYDVVDLTVTVVVAATEVHPFTVALTL